MKLAYGYRRSWHFKIFSILSSGSHLDYQSETILAILVGRHQGNIPVKFESHWRKGLEMNIGEVDILSIFYFMLWRPS